MKVIKIILGYACLLFGLLCGVVVFLDFQRDLPLLVSAIWLAATGAFLVVRRNMPMSRDGRIRFILSTGLCFGFFLFVTAPDFVRTHSTRCGNACINNLRQIDAAVNEFALEHHLTNGAPVNFPSDLTPYIKLDRNGKIPPCPDGGVYHVSKVGESPTCTLGNTVTPGHFLP